MIRMAKMLWAASLIGLPAIGFGGKPAYAIEAVSPTGPIGGTDIRAALLPPPGLYASAVGVDIQIGNINTQLGNVPASGSQQVGGLGLLYVYDTKLFGGSLGSTIFTGGSGMCFGPKTSRPQPCTVGFADVYSDLLLWSYFIPSKPNDNLNNGLVPIMYGLAFQLGFGTSIPAGTYDISSRLNAGSNFFDFTPNIAVTYTVPSVFGSSFGQATEFSARGFYHYYTRNGSSDYQTGNMVSLDFAVTQRWDNWQFGLAGTTWMQIADDKLRGVSVSPNGKRARYFGVGPLVSYDFMSVNKPWNLTVKATIGIAERNSTAATAIVARLSTKLY